MEYFLTLERLIKHLKQHPADAPYALGAGLAALLLLGLIVVRFRKPCAFVLKGLRRNLLRTTLTSLAVMALVFVVTLVWSFLVTLDVMMAEKTKDLKGAVTERWQIPSQLPLAYAPTLEEGAAARPEDVRPEESMTWQFYVGTLDPAKRTRDNLLVFYALDPRGLRTMMDDLEDLDPALVAKMVADKRGVILGREQLRATNKRVGDRLTLSGVNYKGIDLEFEVVGELPDGRYSANGVMNRDYLNDALDAYPRNHNGTKHFLADKGLVCVWLRVPDTEAFTRVADQIMSSTAYTAPAVKFETASSGVAAWLAPYRDLLWGLKWLLVPALLVTMTLVLANAIGISLRERRTETAVLKVLGFGPGRILALVLGEVLLVGGASGLLGGGLSYWVVHHLMGGIKFPVAGFPVFDIYADALWWGLSFGAVAAFLGGILPAWSARTVKVSDVFAKVT